MDCAITGHHVSPLLRDSQVCSRTLVTSSVRPRCVGSEKGSETNKDLRGYDDYVPEPVGDVRNHGFSSVPVHCAYLWAYSLAYCSFAVVPIEYMVLDRRLLIGVYFIKIVCKDQNLK